MSPVGPKADSVIWIGRVRCWGLRRLESRPTLPLTNRLWTPTPVVKRPKSLRGRKLGFQGEILSTFQGRYSFGNVGVRSLPPQPVDIAKLNGFLVAPFGNCGVGCRSIAETGIFCLLFLDQHLFLLEADPRRESFRPKANAANFSPGNAACVRHYFPTSPHLLRSSGRNAWSGGTVATGNRLNWPTAALQAHGCEPACCQNADAVRRGDANSDACAGSYLYLVLRSLAQPPPDRSIGPGTGLTAPQWR